MEEKVMKVYKVWGFEITQYGIEARKTWGYFADEEKVKKVLEQELAKLDLNEEWWKYGIDTIEVDLEKGE